MTQLRRRDIALERLERERSDWQKTQRRLEQVRAVLDRGHGAEQSAERDTGIEM